MFLVFLLYALFASVFTIAKVGLEYSQPFFLVGSRMLVGGIVLVAYQYFFRRDQFYLNKAFGKILQLAFFNIYLTNVFEFWGLKYLTSFKTCFIYSTSPFISALFSYFMFSEKMTAKKWLGLIVGFGGLIPTFLSEVGNEGLTGHFFFFSWAELSVLIAAVSSVYGWIVLRQIVRTHECSPMLANGLSMIIGGGFALLHSGAVEKWDPIPVTHFQPFIECALALLIISNIVCYNLYGFLLKKYSATFMSFAGFTTQIFSALFGWIFLGEILTLPFYITMVVITLGLLIFYQEELKSEYSLGIKPLKA